MSTALAIAGVTAVLRDLLNDGIINHSISGTLGSSVTVSVLAPDRVVAANGSEASQINLFLYLVTPNPGWRNEGLASRDASGRVRLSNPPLALDLHYLLSVYSAGDLHAEILLGYAMQLLHETPVLTREAIRRALTPSPAVGTQLPPALQALEDSGLDEQVEMIKLTPQYLSTEEMSKLWTAMQSHFRPTAAYMASVVLIQAALPSRTPLPVLTRGVEVNPALVAPLPALTSAQAPARQPVARIGDTITLSGHNLAGRAREVLLTNDRFKIDHTIPAQASRSAAIDPTTTLQFRLKPADAAVLPVGLYRVGARLRRAGEGSPRETNRIAMTLAPEMTNLPLRVARVGGTASFSIQFVPELRVDQTAVLILGQDEFLPLMPGSSASQLNFEIPNAPVGTYLARLRVDGIESAVVDLSDPPPALPKFRDQRVVIT